MELQEFFRQLKRRNVFKVAVVYAVTGWLVIQVVTSVFPAFTFPAWTTQFVIILVLIGFPIAMVIAWAFELTPDGIKRTENVKRDQSISRITGRKLNNTVLVLLVLAVVLLSYKVFFGQESPAANQTDGKNPFTDSLSIPPKSVAVLPFINDSRDSSDRYFSDGLSEELIIALSQYPGLHVIGRESSFQFRGKNLDSHSIGEKLKVAHLLEGSVSREGGEIRVRAELVDVSDGRTIWSEHYDRPFKNLFALQDNITHTVASALQAKLLANNDSVADKQIERPPSGNIAAYNAYLQGRYYFEQYTENSLRQAIGYFRKSTRIDPEYTAAYSRLSGSWLLLGANYMSGSDMQKAREKAEAYADTALNLDPNSVTAHIALGILNQYNEDWQGAEDQFQRALQLAPSFPATKQLYSFTLASLGKLNEAIRLIRTAIATNPLNAHAYAVLSRYLAGSGKYEEADQAISRAVSLEPNVATFHSWKTITEVLLHHNSAALKTAHEEIIPSMRNWALYFAYDAMGDNVQAHQALTTLIDGYSGNSAYQIAEIYAYDGNADKAFTWLDRALHQRDPGIGYLLYDPMLLRYRNDPRFIAFCAKAGLPAPDENSRAVVPSFVRDSGK